jgi:hypothetical protein
MAQVGAKVTHNAQEAARLVASGTPVVLVTESTDPVESFTVARSGSRHLPDCDPRGLVAVMAGPPGPGLDAAAAEMAAELFVWARPDGTGPDGTGPGETGPGETGPGETGPGETSPRRKSGS